MREIVLDTETTGFEPNEGHRLVEIGCVELLNHMPTGRTFHQYINPQRDVPPEAQAVHGLDDDFLRPMPVFSRIVDSFLDFLGGARLIIHNAAFDMKFLNAELQWAGRPSLKCEVIDTLTMARRRFPGAPASLDALCRRFGIDNSSRTLHGALLDSQILAEVYLELIGGRQPDFGLSAQPAATPSSSRPVVIDAKAARQTRRASPLAPRLTESERKAHETLITSLGENAIWRRYDS